MKRSCPAVVTVLLLSLACGPALANDESPLLADRIAAIESAETWDSARAALEQAMQSVRADTSRDSEIVESLESLSRQAWRIGEPRWSVELWTRVFDVHLSSGTDAARRSATQIAQHLERLGDLEQAEAWTRRSLELGADAEHDWQTRNDFRRLAHLIDKARPDDPEAIDALEQAVAGEKAESRARQLGEFLAARGDHDAAILHLQEALSTATPAREWSLRRDLASSYRSRGEPELAEMEYGRALAVAQRVFGERDLELMHLQRQIGEFHVEQNQHVQADLHLHSAYEMARLFYGDCPTCSGPLLQALNALYEATDRPVDFCDGSGGEPAPTGDVEKQIAELDEQAATLRRSLESARARQVALHALELRAGAFGEDSVQYANGLYRLLKVSPTLGNTDEQAALRERRIRILEPYLAGDDIAIAYDLSRQAMWAKERADLDAAERYFLRAAYAQESHNQNLMLVRTLGHLADLAEEQDHLQLAGEYRERIVDTWALMAERDSRNYFEALQPLLEIYRELGRPEEAERLLVELLEVYDENPDLDSGDVARELEKHREETGALESD